MGVHNLATHKGGSLPQAGRTLMAFWDRIGMHSRHLSSLISIYPTLVLRCFDSWEGDFEQWKTKSIELLFTEYREMENRSVSVSMGRGWSGSNWDSSNPSSCTFSCTCSCSSLPFSDLPSTVHRNWLRVALKSDRREGTTYICMCFHLAWIFRLNVKTRKGKPVELVCCVEAGLVYGRYSYLGVPTCCAYHYQRLHRRNLAVTWSLKGSSGSEYSR